MSGLPRLRVALVTPSNGDTPCFAPTAKNRSDLLAYLKRHGRTGKVSMVRVTRKELREAPEADWG